jgi:hypothetical protein
MPACKNPLFLVSSHSARVTIGVLILCSFCVRCFAQNGPSNVARPQPAAVMKIQSRFSHLLAKATNLTYTANIIVQSKVLPNGSVVTDRYSVRGVLQHPVYAKIEELQAGHTVLTLASNPQHLYLYSPVSNTYVDDGNVPVYFAVEDMLLSGGIYQYTSIASASQKVGYFNDIEYYFGGQLDGIPLWQSIGPGRDPTPVGSLTTITTKAGKVQDQLVSKITQSSGRTIWTFVFDPKSGLPLRVTINGTGPVLNGGLGDKVRYVVHENYTSFKLSNTPVPNSMFDFTPPAGAMQIRTLD